MKRLLSIPNFKIKFIMQIKKILCLLCACLCLFSCVNKEKQPNFVFILVDDLGWADIKCNFPESFYDTPNLDRLAQEGIRFTQAYAACPVCSPTRGAIMTGKHPCRIGITDWIPGDDPKNRYLHGTKDRDELALEETTIAEKLKEEGYKTCFVGKWHLGGEGYFPEDQGFDINIGGHHKGSPPGGYYSPYKNPKLTDGPEGEYLPDRLTSESIRFINANKENPFLLYLSFYTVHTPIQASVKHIDKCTAKRNLLNLIDVPFKKEGEGWTKMIQEDAAYASMIAAMDENVGRILAALKQSGLDENTWVFFTSDNGGLSTARKKSVPPTNNGSLRAGKGWCYEGGVRVPLIIKGPKIKGHGRIEGEPVISMDYFPTILALAGVPHEDHDGENLTPLLTKGEKLSRDELFWHYPHYHGSAWKPGSAIRKGDWKLIVYYEDNKAELFNLRDDPGETTDVSGKYPVKLNEMKLLLEKKLAEVNAEFPEINTGFRL